VKLTRQLYADDDYACDLDPVAQKCAPLARLETQVALRSLGRRFSQLRIAPGQELTYLPALTTHPIAELQVLAA